MVKIKKQLVSKDVINKRSYGHGNPCNYVVVHQTGNTDKGANAQSHADLQSNLNPREASWHYTVSNSDVIQSFDDSVRCWATNDGRKATGGNMTGIHVELCINSDGNYKQTVQTGAKLVAQLLKKHKLSIDKVKQHADFFNKNCPAQIRAGKEGITWDKFINMVRGATTPKPSKPSKTQNKGYTGNSIVDYLRHMGQSSSFSHRAKLADQHGIKNYRGTASQNLELLDKLRNGAPKKTNKNVTSYKGSSIVDYLNLKGNKHLGGSSFANRKKLAKQYGINKYTGTATQNTQLLKKLQK